MAGPEAQHRGHRRGGAVERPVEPAEGDHARAHRGLGEDDQRAEVEPAGGGGVGQRPEHGDVRAGDQQQAPDQRPLAQARRRGTAARSSRLRRRDEALDHPVGQAEQPQLLGRRRIDREPVGVLGVALGRAHLVGVAVAPDRALAQQPVGGEPGAARAASGAHQAYANSTTAEASPAIISTRPPAMKSMLMYIGGPVMPRSNSRATVRSLVSLGSSRWPMPGGRTQASVSRS